MSVLNKLSYFQDRRDEVPNQELAKELATTKNSADIQEIVDNLWHKNRRVQSDCVKVLYEIGYIAPELIANYANDFLKLLKNRHNRLVWGGMTALSTIADIRAARLFEHVATIQQTMDKGSVITRDAGILTLGKIAAQDAAYNEQIFPYLLNHLVTCRPKDVPQHAEKTLIAVNASNKEAFIKTLEKRQVDLNATQLRRVKKTIREANNR
ncbi:MAG: hypothetical protein GY803_13595 [Chloroflexi bacterium]|nr:hypothetical protein [Chloroflexota bacterium]